MQNYRKEDNYEGIKYAPDSYETGENHNTSIEYCNPLMKQVIDMKYDSKN